MTRVGGPGTNPAEGRLPSATDDARRTFGDDRRDWFSGGRPGNPDGGLGRDTRFGREGPGAGIGDDRENAFRDRMRHALGEVADGTGASEDAARTRLLAVAGGMPLPAGLPVAAAEGGAGRAEWAGVLVDRVEQALRAQPLDGARAGISLKLDLADPVHGVTGLTITMSAAGIDVVLTRAGAEATAAWLAAAQALADRLQARFPGRMVRVHEVEDGRPARAAHGLDEISRLFGQQGGGS